MLPGEKGLFFLPEFRLDGRGLWVKAGLLKQELQKKLGVEVNVLRRAYYRADLDTHRAESIYILEGYPPLAVTEGQWIGREALTDLPLASPAHRSIIETYFTEAEGSQVSEQRPSWARPGWYETATAWIKAELAQLGHHVIDPIEPVRNWSLSYVLRARTATNTFYFKAGAVLPLFVNEAALLSRLAASYPDHIPMPLSLDRERHWMLLADLGEPIEEKAAVTQKEILFRTFGQIQIEAAAQVEELLAMGCLDRRLDRLTTQIEPLLKDLEATTELNENEIEQLQQLIPHLKARCDQLAGYGVPQTLVHGDLHTGNVALFEGKMVFFDWTDACVAHPFFDVMLMMNWENDLEIQTRLRDQYLSLWTAYEPMARLLEMWSLAQPLFALHHAISYQHIVAGLEATAKYELIAWPSYWLRKVLNYTQP
jgi:fructosamine-3-kinase